tara:strand:- start:700 stop:957 length:258 start_codon:yes stop_codon:yes gene_type:complete
MATFYAMTVPEFLGELGLSQRDVFDLEWRLPAGGGGFNRSPDWGFGGCVAGDDISENHTERADHDCAEDPASLPILSGGCAPRGC